jgi:energy-coupling factor transport system permease protein
MKALKKPILVLDPRTKIVLLMAINIFIFTNSSLIAESIVLAMIFTLLILSGLKKTALKGLYTYIILLILLKLILPFCPRILAATFNIAFVTIRKLLPCWLLGTLLIKTTPIRLLMYTLQKWHIPQTVTIPLSITIRYFPALNEERQAIGDAMKLRNVKGIVKKIEYIYIPLMILASNTADELSQAIVTRGIENPRPKTCAIEVEFKVWDYMLFVVSFVAIMLTVL